MTDQRADYLSREVIAINQTWGMGAVAHATKAWMHQRGQAHAATRLIGSGASTHSCRVSQDCPFAGE